MSLSEKIMVKMQDIIKAIDEEKADPVKTQRALAMAMALALAMAMAMAMAMAKEISVEDMQKIVDANEKLVKELKDNEIHGK